jgi:hypothetical protein
LSIVLSCRRCGGDCDSGSSRDAVCFVCIGRDLIANELAGLRKQLLHRERYARKGLLVHHNDSGIVRLTDRARRRLWTAMRPDHAEHVLQLLSRELGEQLQKELAGAKRIRLPKPGEVDLIQRHQVGELLGTHV